MKVAIAMTREGQARKQPNSLPPMARLFFSFPGQIRACGGIFLSALFTIAPALPAKEKPEKILAKITHGELTRSLERDIQGCRNKPRPYGTITATTAFTVWPTAGTV